MTKTFGQFIQEQNDPEQRERILELYVDLYRERTNGFEKEGISARILENLLSIKPKTSDSNPEIEHLLAHNPTLGKTVQDLFNALPRTNHGSGPSLYLTDEAKAHLKENTDLTPTECEDILRAQVNQDTRTSMLLEEDAAKKGLVRSYGNTNALTYSCLQAVQVHYFPRTEEEAERILEDVLDRVEQSPRGKWLSVAQFSSHGMREEENNPCIVRKSYEHEEKDQVVVSDGHGSFTRELLPHMEYAVANDIPAILTAGKNSQKTYATHMMNEPSYQ